MTMNYSGDYISDSDGGKLKPSSSVMRNRIINGACMINQRGASSYSYNGVGVDMWNSNTNANYGSWGQNLNSITPPVGFSNYIGTQCSGNHTFTGSDYININPNIEGYNIADLCFGTANAKTFTISFWVQASIAGTYSLALSNGANNYTYRTTYSIPSTNTWTYVSLTINPPTGGTWVNTNTRALNLWFGLGVGTTYAGSAGTTWNSDFLFNSSGCVNLMGTSGATWYITGLQLEVGSSATGYEYRQYGQELALCQRYYRESTIGIGGSVANSGTAVLRGTHPATMRTTPSTGGSAITIYQLTVGGSWTQSSFSVNPTVSSATDFTLECPNFSGLTGYYPVGMVSGKITFSAEL